MTERNEQPATRAGGRRGRRRAPPAERPALVPEVDGPAPPDAWRYRWETWSPARAPERMVMVALPDGRPEGFLAVTPDDVAGKSEDELRAEVDRYLQRLRATERFLSRESVRQLSEGLNLLDALAEHVAAEVATAIAQAYRERAAREGAAARRPGPPDEALREGARRAAGRIKRSVYAQLARDPEEEARVQEYFWRHHYSELLQQLEERLRAQGQTGTVTVAPAEFHAAMRDLVRDVHIPEAVSRLLPPYGAALATGFLSAMELEARPLTDLEELLGLGGPGGGLVLREDTTEYLPLVPLAPAPKPPAAPSSPDPFAGGRLAPFATGAPAFGAVRAILHARAWEEDGSGLPRFVHKVEGPRFRGLFEYQIRVPADLTREEAALTHKQLADRIRDDLGYDTVWLHMLFLAYAIQAPEGQAAAVARPLVYRALGLDRRTDLTRAEKDARCDEELRRLGSLGLTILRAQLNGQELDYHKRSTVLWQLTKDEYGQARFEPDGAGFVKRWEEWQVLVQPGAWAPTFLHREGLRQFGHISPEMFNIDRRRAPWGAALAVLLAFEGRFDPRPRLRLPNRKIVEFAGGNPAPLGKDERRDTIHRLVNAILEQEKWGWRPDYREWPAALRPDRDADRADGMLTGDGSEATPRRRPRGYSEALLDAATWFEAPAGIYALNARAAPARRGRHKAETRRLPAPLTLAQPSQRNLTASDLRELRERLGLTQGELAVRLGISQAMVSRMEQGKRRIPPDAGARLAEPPV